MSGPPPAEPSRDDPYFLGVDIGTTYTAAAVSDRESTRIITLGGRAGAVPTLVYLRRNGSLVFGEPAQLQAVSDPGHLVRELKRRMGDDSPIHVADEAYRTEDLYGAVLQWVIDVAAMREGRPPARIAVAHPANWGSHKLAALARAVEAAGAAHVVTVTEPHAAAAYYSDASELREGDIVAVYDLGGGTFDAAVLRRGAAGFELLGRPEGVEHLGGVDFDEALFHHVRLTVGDPWGQAERLGGPAFAAGVADLRREIVAAKEELSFEPEAQAPVLLPGVSTSVRITRGEFEAMIRPALGESIGAFTRALRSAGVTAADLRAVLLAGGSSRIPLVRRLVADVVGADVAIIDSDPKYAVALGAAMLAAESVRMAAPRRPSPAPAAAFFAPAAASLSSAPGPAGLG
ncbi:MAG: Hsp70 family protein, partial [Acidimicrobiales bacterium]